MDLDIAVVFSASLSAAALGFAVRAAWRLGFRNLDFFAVACLVTVLAVFTFTLMTALGLSPRWLILHQNSMVEISGLVTGFFAVMSALLVERFISSENAHAKVREEKSVQEQLRQSKSEADAARLRAEYSDRAKGEFLANMSHELRTPLNAILGYSTMMESEISGPLGNEKYRQYSRNIKESGDLLLNIINDILDLSKIEAGAYFLHDSEFCVSQAIQRAVDLVGPRAEEREVDIQVATPNEQIRLMADERALKQMLLNLLSNAIKFSFLGGKVKVSTHIVSDGAMEIRVADKGIGIAAKDISLVFAPFGQVEQSYSRSQQGTGLGMPLTKRLIEQHGGQIVLKSALNAGTTVTLRFPAERVVIKEAPDPVRFELHITN